MRRLLLLLPLLAVVAGCHYVTNADFDYMASLYPPRETDSQQQREVRALQRALDDTQAELAVTRDQLAACAER
jgi:hypothetical protein